MSDKCEPCARWTENWAASVHPAPSHVPSVVYPPGPWLCPCLTPSQPVASTGLQSPPWISTSNTGNMIYRYKSGKGKKITPTWRSFSHDATRSLSVSVDWESCSVSFATVRSEESYKNVSLFEAVKDWNSTFSRWSCVDFSSFSRSFISI